jgi:hypothetical protein
MHSSPALLSAAVSLRRSWDSTFPASFPPAVPCPGSSFPPQGPSGTFPCFIGTVKSSDSSLTVPPCFVAFAWRYHLCARSFAPGVDERSVARPGLFFYRAARPVSVGWSGRGLPGSWGTPLRACPGLRPRWDLHARLFGVSVLPSLRVRRRLPRVAPFEAQSRSRCAPCVRFADEVALDPRNTRFWLVASLCQAGVVTCWVPSIGFVATSIPPIPGFAWRTHGGAERREACTDLLEGWYQAPDSK